MKHYYIQEEKKKKSSMRPPASKLRPTDSESDMLTTLPSMHMALTHDQAQNACKWGLHI